MILLETEARIADLAPTAALEGLLADAEVQVVDDDLRLRRFPVPDNLIPLVRGVYGVG